MESAAEISARGREQMLGQRSDLGSPLPRTAISIGVWTGGDGETNVDRRLLRSVPPHGLKGERSEVLRRRVVVV